ncbi:MAG: hypothetical protein H0W09_03820, partial [Solirubrobacterales bacterium]|nr:hypothetical protein [Solirubrobacterales bacterium]
AAGLPDPTAIFNLAFRHQEPLPDLSEASGTGAVANPAWWRDKAQAAALRENSLKPFSARVDFAKLRRGANDPLRGKPAGIPTSGPINRIMSTRFASKQTTRFPDPSCGQPTDCVGQYRGRLQPYVVNPTMDFPRLGTVGDHAYWLSGLRLRDGSGQAPLGRVEAFSQGFGRGVPVAEPTEARNGTLEGGNIGPLNFTETSRAWGPSEPQPKRNRLSLELENIGRLVVATKRARLNCNARLDVTSDGPVTVRLAGCPGSQSFPASP